MSQVLTRADQQREVDRQVNTMLARSASFKSLPLAEQESIRRNTAAVVDTLVQNKLRQRPNADPFAVPFGPEGTPFPGLPGAPGSSTPAKPTFTGGATEPGRNANLAPENKTNFGLGVAVGVAQTGQMLREVNFPAFVSELVQGVFQAVVDASIQQMRAYGELVSSVTMSLNDFRDQNVTENQGRDHLVSKYPNLMQINVTKEGPRIGLKPGADEEQAPNFAADFGLDEDVDLDEEAIEEKLVPAARTDLARGRQQLLATMLLMGINRIIVTDGKINAKLRFDFHASDHQNTFAQHWDYKNQGSATTQIKTQEDTSSTGQNYAESRGGFFGPSSRSGESSRWSRGTDTISSAPVITLQSQDTITGESDIGASGQLRSDVTLNFKSETFDLNKLTSADEQFKIERTRAAGRGAPVPGTPAATNSGTTTPPSQTPATVTP
jgi:hypothetical protein